MEFHDATMMRERTASLSGKSFRRIAALCRAITYGAAVSPLLLIIVLAALYPDFNRTEGADWRPLISAGDEAMAKADRYEARRLYLQADRMAYWRREWAGLVTAACRINNLDGVQGPSQKAIGILFRAATVAEHTQSYRGLATVALSLSMLGSDAAAAAVLSRSQPQWLSEPVSAEDVALLAGCSRLSHSN